MSNALLFCGALIATKATWNQRKFRDFATRKDVFMWLWLLLSEQIFKLAMAATTMNKEALTQRSAKVKDLRELKMSKPGPSMALLTASFDYLFVGSVFLFFASTFEMNEPLCPFRGTCAVFLLIGGQLMKEEIQCRMLWRNYISPKKVNSWPYTLELISKRFLSTSWIFSCLSTFAILSSGIIDFVFHRSIFVTCTRVWLETMLFVCVGDVVMHVGHRWMHQQAYFLHKKHHEQKQNLTMEGATHFDNVDLVIELFAGVPLAVVLKWALGFRPSVHFFSYSLFAVAEMQIHSGNPYATFFFNPILDYSMRATIVHNLHHFVQVSYHNQIPYWHMLDKKARSSDIALYNVHMKTHFQE